MAEFCKITSEGKAIPAPNPLRIVISNPSDERYRYEGWLEKKYTDAPEYDPETQCITDYWEQEGNYAVQHWNINDIEIEDDTENYEQ